MHEIVLQTELFIKKPSEIFSKGLKIFKKLYGFYAAGFMFLNLRLNTPRKASLNIRELIFEVPSVRSVKIIGTSKILNPRRQAVYFISIWKA
jgi:hypothetical protein